jgi:arylacetamide deacetylase
LAPEHRFPSALNDCLSVTRTLFQRGHEYGVNADRIILSGDSAGGNLALVVGQTLIEEGYRPFLLCLLYPSLQFFDFTLPSYRIYLKRNILGVLNEENLLSMIRLLTNKDISVNKDILDNAHTSNHDKKIFAEFIDPKRYLSIEHCLNESETENESLINDLKYLITPLMSPLLVPDHKLLDLPPVLLFTTEFDILRDEGKSSKEIVLMIRKKIIMAFL